MYPSDYLNFNTQAFCDDISIQKWNNNLSNANHQFNDFYWRLEGCVDRHASLKKVKMKELKLNNKLWITPEISRVIKHRDNLFKRKKRQPNNDNIRFLYNILRNRVNRELTNIIILTLRIVNMIYRKAGMV